MNYALDTNILIEVLRRRNVASREAFARAVLAGEPLVISILVHHELLFGAALHPDPETERQHLKTLIAQIVVEPFDGRDMIVAARLRADLRKRGLPIGPYDVLIAAQAVARGWTMITKNVGEFSRVQDLKLADWSTMRDAWSKL